MAQIKVLSRYKILLFVVFCVILWRGMYHFKSNHKVYHVEGNETNIPYVVEANAVKVVVYYEALCSDSRNFFLKQLIPAFEFFDGFIDLELIPFGKAKIIEDRLGVVSFQCQHGSVECIGNKYHACGIALIKDQALQLQFISCMIKDNVLPHDAAEKCSSYLHINHEKIAQCANGETGSLLLKSFGIRTEGVEPSITFIPTVHLNGATDVPLTDILKDLKKELCNVIKPKFDNCD